MEGATFLSLPVFIRIQLSEFSNFGTVGKISRSGTIL